MQNDCPASLQAVALRVTRLNAEGFPQFGHPRGMYETDGFITVTGEPEIQEGQDFTTPNAGGSNCVEYKEKDKIKWMNHGLQICGPDPEMHELLLGGDILYSGTATDEVQSVTVDATGGTFTLSFNGETTAAIAENATAAAVESALEALDSFEPADVAVSGSAGGPFTVTFGGRYDSSDVAQLTASGASLTGGTSTVTPATTTPGSGGLALGWAMPDEDDTSIGDPVSLEIWTKAIIGGIQHPTLPYFRHLYPYVTDLVLGARTYENGVQAVNFTGGKGYQNDNWGSGPRDDWDWISNRRYQWMQVAADSLPTAHCGILAIPGNGA